jgi:hypothetical protein
MAAVAMAAVLERRVDTHGLAVRAFLHALEHDDLRHPLHFLGRFRRTPTGDPADGTLCSDGYDTDAVGAVGRAVRVDDVEASSDVELCESEGGSGSTWVITCVRVNQYTWTTGAEHAKRARAAAHAIDTIAATHSDAQQRTQRRTQRRTRG